MATGKVVKADRAFTHQFHDVNDDLNAIHGHWLAQQLPQSIVRVL
jgi:hypothetical protein